MTLNFSVKNMENLQFREEGRKSEKEKTRKMQITPIIFYTKVFD